MRGLQTLRKRSLCIILENPENNTTPGKFFDLHLQTSWKPFSDVLLRRFRGITTALRCLQGCV